MWFFHLHQWERITEILQVDSDDPFINRYRNYAGGQCTKCGKTELRHVLGGPSSASLTITYEQALAKLQIAVNKEKCKT